MLEAFIVVLSLLLAGAIGAGVVFFVGRRADKQPPEIRLHAVTERVRTVGKLVGLEVSAKEIATAKKGVSWLPPALLSDARLAMIFQFEKQYHVDLSQIRPEHIEQLGETKFRLTLPPIDGSLRLMSIEPYDIQQGRVLGLFEVIPMNAERQQELIGVAREQASRLFEQSDARYGAQAAEAIERQLRSLLESFGVECELVWAQRPASRIPATMHTDAMVETKLGAEAAAR